MKTFSKTKKHIGLVKYADFYHPTNEASEQRVRELLVVAGFDVPPVLKFDAVHVSVLKDQARRHGFVVHTFHKGLGR